MLLLGRLAGSQCREMPQRIQVMPVSRLIHACLLLVASVASFALIHARSLASLCDHQRCSIAFAPLHGHVRGLTMRNAPPAECSVLREWILWSVPRSATWFALRVANAFGVFLFARNIFQHALPRWRTHFSVLGLLVRCGPWLCFGSAVSFRCLALLVYCVFAGFFKWHFTICFTSHSLYSSRFFRDRWQLPQSVLVTKKKRP